MFAEKEQFRDFNPSRLEACEIDTPPIQDPHSSIVLRPNLFVGCEVGWGFTDLPTEEEFRKRYGMTWRYPGVLNRKQVERLRELGSRSPGGIMGMPNWTDEERDEYFLLTEAQRVAHQMAGEKGLHPPTSRGRPWRSGLIDAEAAAVSRADKWFME